MKFFKKLLILTIGFLILVGIPYLAGNWAWLWLSWLPALIAMLYLNED